LTELQWLAVPKTQVTDAGVELRPALPTLKIDK
jgi:hypothetical protein